jgi:cysteinyl-tRNA synthetase
VAVEAHKKNPGDFVLWKLSSAEEPGWPSPWGRGRPGWHIECSVMSEAHLGKVFDIHGGGLDLIFPHHENEIAQSRCAHGTAVMANYWMHNGFLQVEGQKMSKSLGNFFTIEQLLSQRDFGGRKWHGSVLRLAMLTSHYRQPIDWTVDRLEEAQENIVDWISAASNVGNVSRAPEEIVAALADDLNTSEVIAQMHKWSRKFRTGFDMAAAQELGRALRFLGLWTTESAEEISSYDSGITLYEEEQRLAGTVEPLISARIAARKAKDWKESDRIRDALAAMGVAIKDNKDGTTSWELKR